MPNPIQLKNIKGEDIFPVVERLQSVNKQVTIPTGSTVASVTLDNDKYILTKAPLLSFKYVEENHGNHQ